MENNEEPLSQKVSLHIPNGVFMIALVVLVTIIFQAFGLAFARYGAVLDGKRVTASVYFAHINLSQFQFFLIGYIPTVLTILFFMLAILYSRITVMKYISVAFFAGTQFLAGLGYTRFAFTNPTHTIYHTQSYKVNAIDTGIMAGLIAGGVLLIFAITVLALKNHFPAVAKLHKKAFYLGFFLLSTLLLEWIFAFTNIIEAVSGTPLGL